jgi:hypothetical protein
VDLQIQIQFTEANSGRILASTESSITVSAGALVAVDCYKGKGPNPTSITWNGVAMPTDGRPFVIDSPTAGTEGKLVVTNKGAAGGGDTDRITIKVQ